MARYKIEGRQHRWRLILPLLLGLVIILVLGGLWARSKRTTTVKPTNSTAVKTKISQPQGLAGRYLFHGTTTWSRGVEKDSLRSDGSYDYAQPFSQLNTFEPDKYDAWMTSFECPITSNVVPFSVQVSNLVFNCRPEYLAEARKFFDIYGLANNHTGDQGGETGLVETRKNLDSQPGAQYFGNFDPSVTDDICEVVALPVRVQMPDKSEKPSKLPVAFCGWHYFMRKPEPGEIEQMKSYADIMPVFAFAEMGAEYQATASATQQEIAHRIIDQGPDFLVANNPHWVQNTEVYKGKLIVYATGNFIFDQLQPEEQRSASLDVTMKVAYDKNVAAWLDLSKDCQIFQDGCLAAAQEAKLKKVVPSYTFGVVAGQGGYRHVTHRADAATQAAVEQRMNWAQTLQQLGQ